MEQKEFLKTIQSCRRRLNIAAFLRYSVFALSVAAGTGILFQAAAFVMPFYYVNLYTILVLVLGELAAFAVICARRITMKQAALVMDGFGFAERIVTAYEHLSQEGALIALQRQDAMQQLGAHKDRIRIALLPSWKKLMLLLGLFIIMIGLALIPSITKERAKQLHGLKEEAKEKVQEIEEVMDALDQLGKQELTPEQETALQQMIESLQSSLTEYQQAQSAEMMKAASDKLDYKYDIMSNQLFDLAQSMPNDMSSLTAEALQSASDKLRELSGTELAQGAASSANQGQGSESSQGNGDSQGDGNSQNSGDNQNGSGGNGESGQEGQGSGNGESDQGGQGNGNGQGNGSGSGDGRGTGSSSEQHDYVSVPNAIANSGNLTGNAANHDTSEYFRTQNGLSWEGTHISHEAVIGSYEQNAYEGIAAGKYPSGMEEIIKEYFASF